MMSFYLSGGVEVFGFISPTEPTDEYPVIDPLYGIDGFRNVNTLSDLNSIPNLRRRAGMVVGVSGGTQYYKLNPSPWNGTITDWSTFNSGSGGGTFTGGTVTGDTVFTQGVTATTFSAATYLGLPLDVYVTGGTYSNGTIIFTNNSGGTFNVVGLNTGTTINLSGGTGISVSGTSPNFIVENTLPDQIVNLSGGTNINVTGTYPNFGIEFTGTTSGSFTGGTVTGNTIFTQGVTATTFSASTYLGLPLDVYTTGFTFNSSTYVISIERNDGVTLTQNLSILSSDVTITGGTYNPLNGVATFTNNTGGTFNVSGFITGFTDIQVTGYTYQDNTFTISDSSGNTFSATIDVMTGLTVNGLLSATTLNVNGVNITGDTYTTGGTYSNGTLDFYNNNGGSYQVTGLYTGQTSYVNSLTTGVGLSGDSTTGNVTIINTNPDQVVSISGGTGILTGGTYPNFTIENSLPDQTVVLNNGTNISVTGTYPNFTIDVTGLTDNNTYTTGFTYQDNTFTISDSSGNTLNATINSVTGLTVNGILSATTISGGTLYGDGSNLTGLSTGLNVGTTQITNGTSGRVLFQSGTTLQQDGNFTFDSTLKQLTLRAGGTLSTDIPFRVRNSGNTANILTVTGNDFVGINTDTQVTNGSSTTIGLRVNSGGVNYLNLWNSGGVSIGNNAVATYFNSAGNTVTSVAIGLNTYSWQNSVAIGPSSTANSTSTISIGQSNTVGGSTGTRLVALGSSIDSSTNGGGGSDNIAIGNNLITGRDNNLNIVIGTHLGNRFNFGGSLSVNRNIYIGGYLDQPTNSRNNIITLGYGVSSVSKITPSIDNSFQVYFSDNERSFFVNKNSNVVLKSLQSLTSGTNFDANATNTITISTGTTPSTNIVDSAQIYVTDRGGTAGRASAHFRSEDGTINVLGDRTGINTSTPQARLHVANADTTLTTGLFSGTGQNILTIIGSGNTTSSPIFTVQGSSGELFSVSDSLVGSLFSVNDISGLPILEVFSDNTTLMGSYLAPSLNTTSRVIATTGTTNVYSIPTSAYTGAFFDYTVSDGTNLRAGNIMSIWSGASVNITETQTTDFGNTSGLTFNMVVSSGNAILRTSGITGNWTVKTIVRSI